VDSCHHSSATLRTTLLWTSIGPSSYRSRIWTRPEQITPCYTSRRKYMCLAERRQLKDRRRWKLRRSILVRLIRRLMTSGHRCLISSMPGNTLPLPRSTRSLYSSLEERMSKMATLMDQSHSLSFNRSKSSRLRRKLGNWLTTLVRTNDYRCSEQEPHKFRAAK